jgi:hypothetical protein
VLALLQFALMAGARWDGAAVESMRARARAGRAS